MTSTSVLKSTSAGGATEQTVQHLIRGRHSAGGGRTAPVYDPATGRIAREVLLADPDTVKAAVGAAQEAFPAWRATAPLKRARVLARFQRLLETHQDEVSALVTAEQGKVLPDSRGEVQRGIENVEFATYAPQLLKGEHSCHVGPGIDTWSELQPLGVCVGITPFNFPAMVPLWMWPLAVACGNTFVLKPSERDPSAALYVAELALQAGLPAGVLNVVNGDKEAVDALLTDTRVQAVSFVGSTRIAEYVYTRGSAAGKRVQALGGAKNHAVVMPDADLVGTVRALIGAAFGTCGERCMAISVAVAVGEQTAAALIEGLKVEMAHIKVGPGTDDRCDMGPLVTRAQLDKVRDYIDQGVAQGAKLVVDGRKLELSDERAGFFLGPCLFDHVKPDMQIYQDEIFGPVLCVVRVASIGDAMALIDAHPYGNGTCIFTRDGETARHFAEQIQVGMVGINVPLPVPVATHSFGGWKRSLFGDLGAYGPDAVRFYTRRKTITERWPAAGAREGTAFSFPSHQ
jgi:malonate-semialdehyde dehydrogenase (acetylating)/methylmalonate-semialdehyde dehydrogenase